MNRYRKKLSRFKRDVELTRHRSTTVKYSSAERAIRKRISKSTKELNKAISKLNTVQGVKSYAKDKLYERLEKSGMITKSGTIRVNLPSTLTDIDYRNIEASIKAFKKSPSGTIKGLKRVIKNQRQNLIEATSNIEWVNSLSDREIMEFNKMYSDISFELLSRTMGSDTVKYLAEDAAQYHMTKKDFKMVMEDYMTEAPDAAQRQAISKLYDKYVTKLM